MNLAIGDSGSVASIQLDPGATTRNHRNPDLLLRHFLDLGDRESEGFVKDPGFCNRNDCYSYVVYPFNHLAFPFTLSIELCPLNQVIPPRHGLNAHTTHLPHNVRELAGWQFR